MPLRHDNIYSGKILHGNLADATLCMIVFICSELAETETGIPLLSPLLTHGIFRNFPL
jgi:hypothetical protein